MRQTLVSVVFILAALSARGAKAQMTPAAVPAAPPPSADHRPTSASVPEAVPRPVAVRFTLSPEWGYRTFRDKEPSSTDKRYIASGIPAASARLELYPLAFVTPAIPVAKDFGVTATYSRAVWLKSDDIDTNTEIDTQWYQFSFGARYRIVGDDSPLTLGFTLGLQRWVFDFNTTPPSRPIAIGRYTLLPVGADARYAWGKFSIFADGRFLLPLTVSPLGTRTPSGARLGFNFALGAALALSRMFEVEARAAYTMIYLSLPSADGRADQRGTVFDQYLVFGAGATLAY